MTATEMDCVTVRLHLLLDRIVVIIDYDVPPHTFSNLQELRGCHRMYNLRVRHARRHTQMEYRLRTTKDRRRYETILQAIQQQITENLPGYEVHFRLGTDKRKLPPWPVDRPSEPMFAWQ